jgi:hypothetical protein
MVMNMTIYCHAKSAKVCYSAKYAGLKYVDVLCLYI